MCLQVGGEATVFRGVTVKVKCPVRHFDRASITWWRGGRMLGTDADPADDHIFVTKKGAIKISKIHYADSGVYVCKGSITYHINTGYVIENK